MVKVAYVADLLEGLLLPGTTETADLSDVQKAVDECLAANLRHVEERLNSHPLGDELRQKLQEIQLARLAKNEKVEECVRWKYVTMCLNLLLCLQDALSTTPTQLPGSKDEKPSGVQPATNLLSMQQEKIIGSSIQFVVCLGIIPNFLPGVGLPLEKRTGFSNIVKYSSIEKIPTIQKQIRLLASLKALLQCIEQPTLATLILPRFLTDVLAALCQLGYAPSKYFQAENVDGAPTSSDTPHSPKDSLALPGCADRVETTTIIPAEWLLEQKLKCRQQLDSILDRIYQPLVVRELLVLQSSSLPDANKTNVPKTPLWLRKTISSLLVGRVLKPNGVQAVIRGVLDVEGKASHVISGEGNVADWRKCDVVAKLIATCPTQFKSPEDYYQVVCPQVINLLEIKDKVTRRQFLRVTRSTISLIAEQHPELARKFIFVPVLKPLLGCCKTDIDFGDLPFLAELGQNEVVSADELSQCIENLQLIFEAGGNPNAALLGHLRPMIGILFHLYSSVKSSVLHTRSLLQNLLIVYLKHCSETESVSLLKFFLFPDQRLENIFQWNSTITVNVNGGLEVDVEQQEDEFGWLDEDEVKVNALVDLLVALNLDNCVSKFFLALLEELTVALGSTVGDGAKKTPTSSRHLLLDIEEAAEKKLGDIRRSLLVVHMLRALTEKPSVQEWLLKDKMSALHFIQVTLERGAEICRQNSSATMENETLSMAMSFVVLMLSEELTTDMKIHLKDLLPALEVLRSKHMDKNIQELASQLRVAILTHNAVKPTVTEPVVQSTEVQSSSTLKTKKMAASKKGLTSKRRTTGGTSPNSRYSPDEKTDFQKAWFDASDPLVPVQGHGLLTLSKLVLAKDKETLQHKDQLLHLFQKSLDHEDSYIYLMAIQGLASLASIFPDDVVPLLAAEFADFEACRRKVPKSPELRMKLGEVLVKSSRDLGDMLPKYREPLLNAFLCGTRDEDKHVRASSLSNLGEVCRGLRYSVGRNIHEIFNCLSSFVKTDPAVEVRRAAALVLTLLLRGLGKVAFDVLGDLLTDIYRLLKEVYVVESDGVVKLHIQLALEELNILAKDFLFPQQSFSKMIHVLDPP